MANYIMKIDKCFKNQILYLNFYDRFVCYNVSMIDSGINFGINKLLGKNINGLSIRTENYCIHCHCQALINPDRMRIR